MGNTVNIGVILEKGKQKGDYFSLLIMMLLKKRHRSG